MAEINDILDENQENSDIADRLSGFEGFPVSEKDIVRSRVRNEVVREEIRDLGLPQGFHNENNGAIAIAPVENPCTILEHELVHRLLDIETGNYEEQQFHSNYNSDEEVEIIESRELASRYDTTLGTTRALFFNSEDKFEDFYIRSKTDSLMSNINEDGEMRTEKGYETPMDEVLTFYLDGGLESGEVDSEFFSMTDDQYELIREYMERLDKDCDFQPRDLIREFSNFETYQELERRVRDRPSVPDYEEDQLNCYGLTQS